jgi:hypothetical protein
MRCEYVRLLGVWRMAEEERVGSLRKGRGGRWRRRVGVFLGKGIEESGEELRRRFAKGKVTPVVELLWE